MGFNPRNTNDKLAPRLAKEAFLFLQRLLVIFGKPLFILILICLKSISYLLKSIDFFNNLFLKVKYLIRPFKKRGTIFYSKDIRLKLKIGSRLRKFKSFIQSSSKNFNKTLEKTSEFYWNLQVFPLALEKFLAKFWLYLKARLRIKDLIYLFFLKLKLLGLIFIKLLPKPSFLKISKLISFVIIFIFIASFTSGLLFWQYILKDLPSPSELTIRNVNVSTKIYDRNGKLLYKIYKEENRTPVKLKDIPPQVKLSTIAIEDAEFYSHPGFSLKGILRAIIRNIKRGELTGGSTITQQLVKNTLLSPEKTFIRKLKELTLAIMVENKFSKDEILEMYLNEVSYGGTAYGIQEASRAYFNKDEKDLSLAEAAFLAGLPKSPTQYSPWGSNPELGFNRQKEVLRLMKINGFITEEQKENAESQEINFAIQKTEILAPHFVMFIRQILEDKYGKEFVESGGLEVTTSIDLDIQKLVEEVIKQEIQKLSKLNVNNSAVVVLDPNTGEILAMVGSKDYFNTENDGNVNVALRQRSPGSSIKIINYSYALMNGFTASTIIPDTPVTFLIENQPPYSPKNYEGNFRGNLTLRSALAESRNIPAVKVLYSYGVENMIAMGQKMGIQTWNDPGNYGLSLTLGGGDVRLLDLAYAYATIANYGKYPEMVPILKISDYKGSLLYYFGCEKKDIPVVIASSTESADKTSERSAGCSNNQVVDPRVSFIITDILRDNIARSPTFGNNSLLVIPKHGDVAVKTGTSNDLRDNLTIGYNQKYLVAVWVGNNDNSPMNRIASGITGATPIWHDIMTYLLANEESVEWPIPDGLVRLPICTLTGNLACEGCPIKMEWFLEENKPTTTCSPEWFQKQNNDAGNPHNTQLENQQSSESNFSSEIIDTRNSKKKKNILKPNYLENFSKP